MVPVAVTFLVEVFVHKEIENEDQQVQDQIDKKL